MIEELYNFFMETKKRGEKEERKKAIKIYLMFLIFVLDFL